MTEGLKLEKASSSFAVKSERPAMAKPDTSTGSFFELHAAVAKIDGLMTVAISNRLQLQRRFTEEEAAVLEEEKLLKSSEYWTRLLPT